MSIDMDDENMWVEILTRLPVKMICRFQSVCKKWKSLISSPFFITHHLHKSTNEEDSNKPYVLFLPNNSYAIHNPQDCPLSLNFHPSPFPLVTLSSTYGPTSVVYVIHGVICLSNTFYLGRVYSSNTVLWNPTIHKYVEIPSSLRVAGFGFDRRNNEFKIVRKLLQTYEVFSTRTSEWRNVPFDHIGACSFYGGKGFFVNGTIHWIIYFEHVDVKAALLMFDCECEEFKTMDLPRILNPRGKIMPECLFTYSGMLSLLTSTECEKGVWVIEEYGVASSWKKLTLTESEIEDVWNRRGTNGIVENGVRVEGIWNGHVWEPSLLLMDGNTRALSYTIKCDEDGKAYFTPQ